MDKTSLAATHQSLSGNILHPNLVNFKEKATIIRQNHIDKHLLDVTNGDRSTDEMNWPVFVSIEEELIFKSKMTITEIEKRICELFLQISNSEVRRYYTEEFHTMKKRPKTLRVDYVIFYEDLKYIVNTDDTNQG